MKNTKKLVMIILFFSFGIISCDQTEKYESNNTDLLEQYAQYSARVEYLNSMENKTILSEYEKMYLEIFDKDLSININERNISDYLALSKLKSQTKITIDEYSMELDDLYVTKIKTGISDILRNMKIKDEDVLTHIYLYLNHELKDNNSIGQLELLEIQSAVEFIRISTDYCMLDNNLRNSSPMLKTFSENSLYTPEQQKCLNTYSEQYREAQDIFITGCIIACTELDLRIAAGAAIRAKQLMQQAYEDREECMRNA